MRQVRRAVETGPSRRRRRQSRGPVSRAAAGFSDSALECSVARAPRVAVEGNMRLAAWQWAQDNQSEDGYWPRMVSFHRQAYRPSSIGVKEDGDG